MLHHIAVSAAGASYRGVAAALCRAAGLRTGVVSVHGAPVSLLQTRTSGRRGRGPTIVALHGFGASKEGWLPIARTLTRRGPTVLPDLPGFGASPLPYGAPVSPRWHAAWAEALAQALGLGRVHVVGHSMGGAAALAWALTTPERVASLTLLGPAATLDAQSLIVRATSRGELPLVPRTERDWRHLLTLTFARRRWLVAPFDAALRADQLARADALEALFRAWFGAFTRWRPDFREIAAPALVIQGTEDALVPARASRGLAAQLLDARLLELPGVGHMPVFEATRAVARSTAAFLDSLAR